MDKLVEAQRKQTMSLWEFAFSPRGATLLPLSLAGTVFDQDLFFVMHLGILLVLYRFANPGIEEKDGLLYFRLAVYASRGGRKLAKKIERNLERYMTW